MCVADTSGYRNIRASVRADTDLRPVTARATTRRPRKTRFECMWAPESSEPPVYCVSVLRQLLQLRGELVNIRLARQVFEVLGRERHIGPGVARDVLQQHEHGRHFLFGEQIDL